SIDGRDNSCKFRGVNGALCKNVTDFAIPNCVIAIIGKMRFDRAKFQGQAPPVKRSSNKIRRICRDPQSL
ncbi:hypothetical protein, partial [Thalassospira sp.]|uniref:hypothetical protein n=1 Tax=Thalassospira sp. TaxID=1912094 RepID=UPI00311D5B21